MRPFNWRKTTKRQIALTNNRMAHEHLLIAVVIHSRSQTIWRQGFNYLNWYKNKSKYQYCEREKNTTQIKIEFGLIQFPLSFFSSALPLQKRNLVRENKNLSLVYFACLQQEIENVFIDFSFCGLMPLETKKFHNFFFYIWFISNQSMNMNTLIHWTNWHPLGSHAISCKLKWAKWN